MIHARVKRLVFGAFDPKQGFSVYLGDESLTNLNHRIEIVSGVLEEQASEQIRAFFRAKRERGKRKWMKNET